jgi:hypothetical protein
MKKRYEVRWYEYNLTQQRSRKFFTKIGAIFFASYMEAYENVEPTMREIDF